MNLEDSVRQLGGWRAIELAAFARLGAWALHEPDDAAARWCASASLAHAWRAEQLAELLPVSVGLPSAEECTVRPPGPLSEALDRALPPALEPADGTRSAGPPGGDSPPDGGRELVERLVGGLYVLLGAAYAGRIEGARPASDGPVIRTITRVWFDLRELTEQGERLMSHSRGRITGAKG